MNEQAAEIDADQRRAWRVCAEAGAEFEGWAVLALLDALDRADRERDLARKHWEQAEADWAELATRVIPPEVGA